MLAKKELRLHNALGTIKTRRDLRLYLTNMSKRPVNLPKNCTVGLAVPYDGPVHEIPLRDLSRAREGADPVATLDPDQGATSKKSAARVIDEYHGTGERRFTTGGTDQEGT